VIQVCLIGVIRKRKNTAAVNNLGVPRLIEAGSRVALILRKALAAWAGIRFTRSRIYLNHDFSRVVYFFKALKRALPFLRF
jgi:hypothetical protein